AAAEEQARTAFRCTAAGLGDDAVGMHHPGTVGTRLPDLVGIAIPELYWIFAASHGLHATLNVHIFQNGWALDGDEPIATIVYFAVADVAGAAPDAASERSIGNSAEAVV